MEAESGGVASVERALRLLEALADGPIGATDLAHKLGASKATAFRLARTLQANGYVVQLEDTRYQLGPRCLMLASWAFGQIDLRRELRWAEEELLDRTGETVQLSVLAGREVVCIDSIPSQRPVVSIGSVGSVWPAHMSSSGLAMLAEDEALLEGYLRGPLARETALTPADPDTLRKVVGECRARGYAFNPGYFREEVCAVAAVVHDATGKAAAALAVMLPKFRMDETTPEELGAIVVDVTRRASERLGWGRPAGNGSS